MVHRPGRLSKWDGRQTIDDRAKCGNHHRPFYDRGTSWNYAPLPTLAAIDAPHLWILAGADREAPSATTLELLHGLQAKKPALDVVVFREADHGIIVGERTAEGKLEHWRYTPGYHSLVVDWLKTRRLHAAEPGLTVYPNPHSSGRKSEHVHSFATMLLRR